MKRSASPCVQMRKVKARLRRQRMRRGLLLLPLILIALTVLVSALCIPVLQIYGSSMSPALHNDDTVAVIREPDYEPGDIIAFEYQGQILTRRVIACPGSVVFIDTNGNVSVDGVLIHEPYVAERSLGVCTVTFPCRVPEGHYFVLGDRRSTSVDSRSGLIGCVAQEDIIGSIFWILLPWESFGAVN